MLQTHQGSLLQIMKQPLASFLEQSLCTGPLYIKYIEHTCIRVPYSGDTCLAYIVTKALQNRKNITG